MNWSLFSFQFWSCSNILLPALYLEWISNVGMEIASAAALLCHTVFLKPVFKLWHVKWTSCCWFHQRLLGRRFQKFPNKMFQVVYIKLTITSFAPSNLPKICSLSYFIYFLCILQPSQADAYAMSDSQSANNLKSHSKVTLALCPFPDTRCYLHALVCLCQYL